jgi:serine/threonine protein kinase
VRGETLTVWLQRVTELDRRLNVLERVCETVAFAHQQGVVHRDLKPDNIMVGAFGEVLVLDWGVARLMSQPGEIVGAGPPIPAAAGHTRAGTVLGTPGFMAPEQALGERVDERADVYALGGILFQMMFDQPPSPNGADTPELHKRRDLPKRLRAICRRALAPTPDGRYPDASALGDDVGRYRAGRSVHAYRETTFDRIERTLTLYRTPILLVLAYLVMRALIALLSR